MKNQVIIFAILILCSCKSDDVNSYLLKDSFEDNLRQISNTLNEDIPDYWYKVSIEKGFNLNVKKNGIVGLNIYDLNTGMPNNMNFSNNHVYHISPINFEKSYSYILCVVDNKIHIFKSINCPEKGNNFDDVTSFINSNSLKKLSPEVMDRLNNYRNYGEYLKVDTMTTLNCDS